MDNDLEALRQHWYDDYEELLQGVPSCMLPWRVVNHEIPLVDEKHKYHYHLPRCPNTLRGNFDEKVARYTRAGWWELTSANQAAPMMCIFKKDTHLRTVVDCHQWKREHRERCYPQCLIRIIYTKTLHVRNIVQKSIYPMSTNRYESYQATYGKRHLRLSEEHSLVMSCSKGIVMPLLCSSD